MAFGLAEHTRWAIAAAFSGAAAVALLVWRAAEAGTPLARQIDVYFFITAVNTVVCIGFSRVSWRLVRLERQAKPPDSGETGVGA